MITGNKFRNPELEAATAQLEAEFNRLLTSGTTHTARVQTGSPVKDDDFYKLVGEIYSPEMKRHVSPTKRLI